jgi:hypothetical protein
MVGRRSPQNPSISRLTLPPETIPSCYRRTRHTKFQPHFGRHLASRFNRIARMPNIGEERFLFVISDGEPTDGDPRSAFSEIRNAGVSIISCFVTDADIADPRVLWAKPQSGWSEGARLMFDIAAPLDERGAFARCLLSRGWEIEAGARLFVQVNHSTVLEEFIRIAESFASRPSDSLLPEGR